MPPNPTKTKCTATNANGRPCKAWAVRDTSPPLCASHSGRCVASRGTSRAQRGSIGAGAPSGNQNRADHGFYGRILENGELADLVKFSEDLSLDDEIGLVRVTLRRVMARFKLSNLERDDVANEEMVKMAGLVMAGARTIARLLRDKRALSGKAADGISGAIAQALDEMGTEYGLPL